MYVHMVTQGTPSHPVPTTRSVIGLFSGIRDHTGKCTWKDFGFFYFSIVTSFS